MPLVNLIAATQQCPHEAACPMKANTWCHFVQRVARTDESVRTPYQHHASGLPSSPPALPSQRACRVAGAFLQRTARGNTHLSYDDEKFSYLVLRRGARPTDVLATISPRARRPSDGTEPLGPVALKPRP